MKRLGVAAGLVMFAAAAGAQGASADPSCASAPPVVIATQSMYLRDACQKAVDLFKYLAPQLGTAIAGGNTILGSGGALGGLPHWTVGLRATAVAGSIPVFTTANAPSVTATSPVASPYTTSNFPIPAPALDVAVGVWGGFPLGVTKIGSVDLLANVAYIPSFTKDEVSITPETNYKFGFGARVGLIQEGILTPGVSVSMIRRGMPKTTIDFTSTAGSATTDTLQIADLDLHTTSYRLTVSKSLILFGLAAGVGMDKYSSSGALNIAMHRSVLGVNQRIANPAAYSLASDVTRTNAFVDGYVNILLLKIIGEVGIASGGEINTFNTFDPVASKARLYGALGLRVGF